MLMKNLNPKQMSKVIFTLILFTGVVFSGFAQMEIMSYNIRYLNETDGENSWSLRKDYLANQIKFYEPEILGVQEAVFEQLEFLKENLPEYDYVGVGRDDGKEAGEFSAIFYDTSEFKVLNQNTFWLSETPDEVSVGWDAAMERVCTYAFFQEKESEKKFWVFNTHFDHIGKEARKNSAVLILDKIKELNKEGHPVILMGDLNLEPEDESIRNIAQKMNDSKTVATKVSFGPEGTFNGYKFGEPVTRRIDYIFTSKDDIEVEKYGVLSDSKDLKYPSDHLPILVELNFKTKK